MLKNLKTIMLCSLVIMMMIGIAGCSANASPAPVTPVEPTSAATPAAAPEPEPVANTNTINVVWYPNESSNTHADVRAEVARLIEQATGRKVENKTTTDYTIAIESIASGAADIAMSMGAVGYIEAKNKNPNIDVMFVNADKNGSLDEAKYFSWLCVNEANKDEYADGSSYSIDNIKGKKMSFVSNSSTSGFRVPTASIIAHFPEDELDEDKLVEGGSGMFFEEVFFGQSHQGSAINLITGNADIAAYCDTELVPYIELVGGTDNTVGAVYAIRADADAPFDAHIGKEFVVIACTPVFNGPNAYNPTNLNPEEVKAIQDLFTSEEVANNEIIFFDADKEGAVGLFKKQSSHGYVLTTDSWYDPYRK